MKDKTSDLIDSLSAKGWGTAKRATGGFVVPFVLAALACALALGLTLGMPLRPLPQIGVAPYAMKLGFACSVAIIGAMACLRIGQPGRSPWRVLALLAFPFCAIIALAAIEAITGGGSWPGETWARCVAAIVLLWPLGFAGFVVAMRSLAPTRPRLASLVGGLTAGGIAAGAYAFWCPEVSAMFLASWYAGPILVLGLAGWLIGPALLRW